MVKGVERVRAKIRALAQDEVRDELRRVLEKSAEEMVREMRILAPKGRTGRLVGSIDWTWGDAPAGTITVGRSRASDLDMRITIYAGGGKAFYARFQEFGTKTMAANPFFFPVYRANRSRVKGRVNRALNRAVRKANAR